MTEPVSQRRWGEAQAAEREYWHWPAIDPREFLHILAGQAEAAVWAKQRFPGKVPPEGDWLEIGIGPLGIGCVHFLPQTAGRRLIGLDPLEPIPMSDLSLPSPLLASVEAARAMYDHHVETGEATTLTPSSFGLVVVHNVLDHVRDPKRVLEEARSALRPQGLLFLACDTHSLLYQLRHKLIVQRRSAASWLVRAHPFRFRPSQVFTLVEESGFHLLAHSLRGGRIAGTIGRSNRLLILAQPA
jgi:SAM-dependent methyltransferase